jgi:hypothetical protein
MVLLALLIPGGDPAELLEPVDRERNQVALTVGDLVEIPLAWLVGL